MRRNGIDSDAHGSLSWCLHILVVLFSASILTDVTRGDQTTLEKPIAVRLLLHHDGKPPEKMSGNLTAWDHDGLSIQARGDTTQLLWTDLEGTSAYSVLAKLIDRKKGSEWLWLGTLAWELNDISDGRSALNQAAKLDPNLQDDADAVEASTAGLLLDSRGQQLLHDVPTDQTDDGFAGSDINAKYQKTTPAQAKAAIEAIRHDAKTINSEMNLHLQEVDTAHFLIYTDWGPGGERYLADQMEKAYALVSRQFDVPVSENVFVGKLPVYMFNKYSDYSLFAQKYDHMSTARGANDCIPGYFTPRRTIWTHLAMSKPDRQLMHVFNDQQAETAWAYLLTHEFTHAFMSRYRSSRPLPRWLDEGIAEVIAAIAFPRDVRLDAIALANKPDVLNGFFEDSAPIFPTSDLYAMTRTMTEMLIARDRRKFNMMIDEIKRGATGSQALKDAYGWTFDDMVQLWKKYIGV